MANVQQTSRVATTDLRWSCDRQCINFSSTAEVDPATTVLGQPTAREALLFGLECGAKGQNIFVRGMPGTGRKTMVQQLLTELKPTCPEKLDRCYVHNFSRPDRPRLLTFPAGQAQQFKQRMITLADFIREGLPKALAAEHVQAQYNVAKDDLQQRIKEITDPLEQELHENGFALVSVQAGQAAQTVIFPVVDGQAVQPEQFQQLVAQGKISAEQAKQVEQLYPHYQQRLQKLGQQLNAVYLQGGENLRNLQEQAARDILKDVMSAQLGRFQQPGVQQHLQEVIADVIEQQLRHAAQQTLPDPAIRYGVNIVLQQNSSADSPVIEENTPTMMNLLGTIEPQWSQQGPVSDYRGIRSGALLRADGGYLILDVHDVLNEPGAWKSLIRTLRNNRLEIVPPETGWMGPQVILKPEPIDVNIRVILIGTAGAYYQLDQIDPDFSELFKVLADFDHELSRDEIGIKQYAAVLAKLVHDEQLTHFNGEAVAELIEHGARIVSRRGKLTANFSRIADIAREAAFLANQQASALVDKTHVTQAVQRTKQRASLPSRKFQEMLNTGTIIVHTEGTVVGQINALAVIQAGPLIYGFPSRITATIGAGQAGLINIEDRAGKSGSIHTKGFNILGGLLRLLLKTDHPLAFSASIAFEQSYGGIDGDSASGAEMCCLLSALTDIPIKQSLSMTGAIDQHGHIEAIGGVNEKTEGFFDACNFVGLTGDQGVIIPQANAGDLMLRRDIVSACEQNKFHIYTVSRIEQALEILTGISAGKITGDQYPEGSLLRIAVDRAEEFWRKTLQHPAWQQNPGAQS